jgi:hypothetical protein
VHRRLLLGFGCLLLLAAGGAGAEELAAVNALRDAAGLPRLAHSDSLARAAAAHADYLDHHHRPGPAAAGVSAHAEQPGLEGYTGSTPQARVSAAGYPHLDVAENVSMGYDDLGAALEGLMSAIYHRLTFLDLGMDEMGVSTSRHARVFVLGRRDMTALCRSPPDDALFLTPLDCLGQPMTRPHYRRLCADLPAEALFRPAHPLRCPGGQRLDADFMQSVCRQPPPEARFSGHGRHYLPCGEQGPRIDGPWFDALCESPPQAALYTASGQYYELCEPSQRVSAEWLEGHCQALPDDARYRDSGRYRRPCVAPHELRVEYLEAFDRRRLAKLPEVVVWPPDGSTDVPPAFFVEEPDPLPDIEVSAYPMSIQFNPAHAGEVVIRRFDLTRIVDDRRVVVEPVRLLDAASDPHGLLDGHEFALFPLQRLDWGGEYEATVEAQVDGGPRRYRWRFRVQGHDLPLLTARTPRERFRIDPGRDYLLYLPPVTDHPHTVLRTRTEHLRGNHVKLEVVDPNTLKLRVQARYCDRIRVGFDDGRVVELVPAGCEAGADYGAAMMPKTVSGG